MTRARSRPLPLVLLALIASLGADEAPTYKVIVNASNPAKVATRAQVAELFLKKVTRWPDGTAVAPVDQSANSTVRGRFSKDVLGQSYGSVQQYWQQRIFSGREIPPPVKSSDEAVIDFVQAHPGAIGYASGVASLPSGVKALSVVEK